MWKAEIAEDPCARRCRAAIGIKSSEPVLQLHGPGLPERLCRSPEWKIAQPDAVRRRGTS